MRITPLDIQQKQFPMKLRGFDVEEVYAFLEVVREEMEDLLRENASLKESVQRLENQIKEHKDMETTLRETLLTAQQMVEDYKTNARKEAELIVKESEVRAEAIIKQAQEKVIKIHEDIVDLKGIRRHFKEELKRMVLVPELQSDVYHVYHLYVIRVKDRDNIRERLAEKGIATGIHYPIPLPFLNAYKYLGHAPENFPIAFSQKDELLSLPIHGNMTDDQVGYVIDQFKAVYKSL